MPPRLSRTAIWVIVALAMLSERQDQWRKDAAAQGVGVPAYLARSWGRFALGHAALWAATAAWVVACLFAFVLAAQSVSVWNSQDGVWIDWARVGAQSHKAAASGGSSGGDANVWRAALARSGLEESRLASRPSSWALLPPAAIAPLEASKTLGDCLARGACAKVPLGPLEAMSLANPFSSAPRLKTLGGTVLSSADSAGIKAASLRDGFAPFWIGAALGLLFAWLGLLVAARTLCASRRRKSETAIAAAG
jgi:hypothetical protein